MASPQRENGYTALANELLEVVVRTPLPARHKDLWFFVARKTYGYSKKEDYISLSQFVVGTGIDRSSVCKIIKDLVAWHLLDKRNSIYKIQKDYTKWVVVPRPLGSGVHANQVVARTPQTKEIIQKKEDTFASQSVSKLKTKKNNMAFKGYNENEFQDDLPAVDADSGEQVAPPPKAGRDPVATRVSGYFFKRASEAVGRPLVNQGYGYVKKFTKVASEDDLIAVVDEFFDREPSEPTSIFKCLNASAINKYLANK